jgi:hypothetical protein
MLRDLETSALRFSLLQQCLYLLARLATLFYAIAKEDTWHNPS